MLGTPPRREAEVLRLRFGLGGEGGKTYDEIGRLLGRSRERVRQVEDHALKRRAYTLKRWSGHDLLQSGTW
jgi:RNA polymerase primary sigma factor